MSRVVVIGGGPAGMFAAIAAAENGHHVTLLEKNEKCTFPDESVFLLQSDCGQ